MLYYIFRKAAALLSVTQVHQHRPGRSIVHGLRIRYVLIPLWLKTDKTHKSLNNYTLGRCQPSEHNYCGRRHSSRCGHGLPPLEKWAMLWEVRVKGSMEIKHSSNLYARTDSVLRWLMAYSVNTGALTAYIIRWLYSLYETHTYLIGLSHLRLSSR